MDGRPTVALIGYRQTTPDGLCLTGAFPNALPAFGDALAERLPGSRPRWLGERDPSAYDRDFDCDSTTGSFMLVRRDALESAGQFD